MRNDVAIVGMSCKYPGSPDLSSYWETIVAWKCALTSFWGAEWGDEVHSFGAIGWIEEFDAGFFWFGDSEADLLDPQQRLFLEHSYRAFEDAWIQVSDANSDTWVFAGCWMSTYLLNCVLPELAKWRPEGPTFLESAESLSWMVANDKDYLATRVSYKLNLKGPSMAVQSACSTSLLAVAQAVSALRAWECAMALAWWATVVVPQLRGYEYQEGLFFSKDGNCRPFTNEAAWTVFSNGVGVVLLKRLSDAIRDGDRVYAVIKGVGISNDWSWKAGYSSPSVSGQEAAIRRAIEDSGLSPDSVWYVETHGTATRVGDAIEMDALRRAYGENPDSPVSVGAVKANIGHSAWASWVAGLIKAALCVSKGTIPVQPFFEKSTLGGGFRLPEKSVPWNAKEGRRRAWISSFWLGGTNVHAIIESAPPTERPAGSSAIPAVLPFSGKNPEAAKSFAMDCALALSWSPNVSAEAFSQSVAKGRTHFAHRWFAIGADANELAANVRDAGIRKAGSEKTVFLFTGYWCQYAWMGKELYSASSGFSSTVDEISEICERKLGFSLKEVLWGERSEESLSRMDAAWVAIFAIQCAVANAYSESGIRPSAVLGHSHGEFAAAYVSGMLDLEESVTAVFERWRLLRRLEWKWSMLAVFSDESNVSGIMDGIPERADIWIAAVNGESNIVVSWTAAAIASFSEECRVRGVRFVALPIGAAGHSPVVNEILPDFSYAVRDLNAKKGVVPFYSAFLGRKAEYGEINREYWVSHMRNKVDFLSAIRACDKAVRPWRYVEIGPKDVLTKLVPWIFSEPKESFSAFMSSPDSLRGFLGSVWTAFASWSKVDWVGHGSDFGRTGERVPVPRYPLRRESHWIGDKSSFRSAPAWFETVRTDWEPCFPVPSREGGESYRVFGPDFDFDSGFDPERTLVVPVRDCGGEDSWNAVSVPLEAIRKWVALAEDAGVSAKVAVVTENSKIVRTGERLSNVAGGSLYGLDRVLALENPDNRIRFVDLDDWSESGLDSTLRKFVSDLPSGQYAVRGWDFFRSKLVREEFVSTEGGTIDADAAYVVTGWSKWIGPHCARKLVEMGARRVFLMWRSEKPSESVESLIRSFGSQSPISYERCDVTDSASVSRSLSEISRKYRIGGLIHAAGVVHDGIFVRQNSESVKDSFLPKARGAENLVNALDSLGNVPDFVLFFSSATAIVGNAWQTSHAIANAYLDSYANSLSAQWYPALSVNWGVWGDVGAASGAGSEKKRESTANFWFVPFDTETWLKVMSAFISGKTGGQIWYVPANWSKIESAFDRHEPASTMPSVSGDLVGSCFHDTFKKTVWPHENFFACWMDSLTALIFRNKLQKAFGRILPPNVAYAHPTLSSLRDFLSGPGVPSVAGSPKTADSEARTPVSLPTEQQIRWISLVELWYGKLLVPVMFDSAFSAVDFKIALKTVVMENPVLRSIVNVGSVVQLTDEETEELCDCPVYDIRDYDDEAKRRFLKNRKDDAYENSPDHRTGVSWKGECVVMDGNRFIFLLFVQHLEFDWTAITSFVDRLGEAYFAKGSETKSDSATYGDFALWQRKYLDSPAFEDDRKYFREKYAAIASIPSLDDSGHDWNSCHPSSCHTAERIPGLWNRIKSASGAMGVSPFSLMARTFSVLLSQITGSSKPVFWTVVQGRPSDEFDRTIWPFVTHFPICVDLESWSETDQCRYVHDFITNVNARCAYPVSDLLKSVPAFEGKPIHTYFCDAFIMMNNYPKEDARGSRVRVLESLGPLDGSVLSGLDTGSLNEMVGLFLIIDFHEGEVRCNFWYHEHRFTLPQVVRWAEKYVEMLRESVIGQE